MKNYIMKNYKQVNVMNILFKKEKKLILINMDLIQLMRVLYYRYQGDY